MPENRKFFVNKQVLFISARVEEGLPLVPSEVINLIIRGVLARGSSLYQVRICHYLFMANHLHVLLVVENPEDVSNFTGYIKGEIAHAVNQLLGRRRKTIWAEGYDSPVLLTAEDTLRYIAYIYANPSEANLVDRIEDYPGVSSWQMFYGKRHSSKHKWIRRPAVPKLSSSALTVGEQKRLVEELVRGAKLSHEFVIEPYAWMECFSETEDSSIEEIREEIISAVRSKEEEYREKRVAEGKGVIGSTSLRRQSMLKEHQPEKFGKKMICICSCLELRRRFIEHYRALCQAAAVIYENWKRGDISQKMPPGMLAPRMPVLVSALPT